jgi:hypothetical protein
MGADQAKIVAIEEHMRAKTDDCLEEMKANWEAMEVSRKDRGQSSGNEVCGKSCGGP